MITSLDDLWSSDRTPMKSGKGLRFFCSLNPTCSAKRGGNAHRSLWINVDTGNWICHRCKASGVLRAPPQDRLEPSASPRPSRKQQSQAALRQAFSGEARRELPSPDISFEFTRWLKQHENQLMNIEGSPGADYLASRGIPPSLLHGIFYAPSWEHWTNDNGTWQRVGTDRRVVFEVRDFSGSERSLVALAIRAIDQQCFTNRALNRGDRRRGVFATSEAWEAPLTLLTEAPIDALSLAACGYPAIAVIGTSWPDWLPDRLVYKDVCVAFDNDPAGDAAAERLIKILGLRGARCRRLRPDRKDFNEDLVAEGQKALTRELDRLLCTRDRIYY